MMGYTVLIKYREALIKYREAFIRFLKPFQNFENCLVPCMIIRLVTQTLNLDVIFIEGNELLLQSCSY